MVDYEFLFLEVWPSGTLWGPPGLPPGGVF